MAISPLGTIIRNRREELGLTQEDLADGVCSVPTLSRIENGERMPLTNIYEMLMQRLGYSAISLDYFTTKREFDQYELRFKIRQAYIIGNLQLSKEYFSRYIELANENAAIEQQFCMLYAILLYEENYTNSQKLVQFENALKLTWRSYGCSRSPRVLSYEEIILLNNIAICYATLGNRNHAISILSMVSDYYLGHTISSDEALRTQPMILYNLSKYLGQNGDYSKCIEVCNVGIRIARETSRCHVLHLTLLNQAWALIQRNGPCDRENAKAILKQAYDFALVMGKYEDARQFNAYNLQVFSEDLSV